MQLCGSDQFPTRFRLNGLSVRVLQLTSTLEPMARFAASFLVIVLLLSAGWFGTASAQGLTNTIPRNQAPLIRTFPPKAEEQTPAGTGKFVIFTREQAKSNEWDFIAGAWECIPSQTNTPVTKRVEFCHSSWNAGPLLDTLVRDNSDGSHPRFVRLPVDTGERDYSVNLYDINYRSWEVRCLWQGERLSAFGAMKNMIFCEDARNWFGLDAQSGKIIKDVPFSPLDVDGAFWLVRKVGEKSGVWSYDLAKGQFVGHFSDVDESQLVHSRSLLSRDGRYRTLIVVPKPDDGRGRFIGGIFLLQRDDRTEDIRVPVMLLTKPIRGGVRLNPIETGLRFTEDGTVEFSACSQINNPRETVWTIDIATGKTTVSVRPHVKPMEDDLALFDGVPSPDYLRKYLKDLRHFGRGGLAPAFLIHLGILKEQPGYPDCTAGVSPDGRHILFRAKKGPLADVFIYGDLQTKQTVRWVSPAELNSGDAMEFVWVETP